MVSFDWFSPFPPRSQHPLRRSRSCRRGADGAL